MKPSWIKVKLPVGERYIEVKKILRRYDLHTVCEEAKCPNLGDCWSRGTATFMILGDVCTRRCKFCAVKTGNPRGKVDKGEPERISKAVCEMNLKYVVITSVDRDDLPDGGAEEFAETVNMVKK
ncbi:MAG: lipoyl synthase, partial [Thermotoga sp.]